MDPQERVGPDGDRASAELGFATPHPEHVLLDRANRSMTTTFAPYLQFPFPEGGVEQFRSVLLDCRVGGEKPKAV
jgi:hypothetical protein